MVFGASNIRYLKIPLIPLLLGLGLTLFSGCTEILYMVKGDVTVGDTYQGGPPSGPGNRSLFYEIDCAGGVICFGPDEERTSIVNEKVIKNCIWNHTEYQNQGSGRLWISFMKSGDGCWQMHRETFEEGGSQPWKLPADVKEMRVQ